MQLRGWVLMAYSSIMVRWKVRAWHKPRQARRPSRHRANDGPCKSRRQVEARQAERQRMFIARLKTGEYSQDTFRYARATAAASEAAQQTYAPVYRDSAVTWGS